MPVRVLLADDKAIVRQLIRRLLEEHPKTEVVGEATNFTQTIQMRKNLKPDVIVMDLHMSGEDDFTPEDLKSHLNDGSRLLAISIWNDEETKALADRFGAVTLLDKMELHHKLIPTIIQVASPNADAAAE
jgi:chemotaxis response regulator CheB